MNAPDPYTSALLIVGHGSTVNPDSAAPSLVHAAAIRRRGTFAEVACVFWKEEPGMRDWPLLFGEPIRDVYVVPNFISEGYFTKTVIPRELEMDGEFGAVTVREDGQRWHYCAPVGNHHSMTELLLRRAREVAPGVPEGETSLLIVGHGTGLMQNPRHLHDRALYYASAIGTEAHFAEIIVEQAMAVIEQPVEAVAGWV